jgi:hypothetical protein
MSWFGTDLVALGCIFGSAAVGGAATLALMDGPGDPHGGCGVEAMALSPRIAISRGGHGQAIVVAPDVRVHSRAGCGHGTPDVVEIHLEKELQNLDVQLEQMDRALELQMQALETQLEAGMEQGLEARFQFEDALRQLENARVKVVVNKVPSGGI